MTSDRVILAVVLILGAFALGGLAGTVWLCSVGAEVGLVAVVSGLTGTAVGLVGSMLNSTRSVGELPTPVTITEQIEPVPTTETGS